MKLPNAHLAVIHREKIVDYLLNPIHPDGYSKADFFTGCGFKLNDWTALATALLLHGCENEVSKAKPSSFGIRYEVDGKICTPGLNQPRIRTVWQIDHGKVAPRLITAHPLEAK